MELVLSLPNTHPERWSLLSHKGNPISTLLPFKGMMPYYSFFHRARALPNLATSCRRPRRDLCVQHLVITRNLCFTWKSQLSQEQGHCAGTEESKAPSYHAEYKQIRKKLNSSIRCPLGQKFTRRAGSCMMHPSPFNWLGAGSYHTQADVVSMEVTPRQKLLIIFK